MPNFDMTMKRLEPRVSEIGLNWCLANSPIRIQACMFMSGSGFHSVCRGNAYAALRVLC